MAENNHIEKWKPIKGYEDRYEVSDHGRVRILNYRRVGVLRLRRLSLSKQGYLHIILCDGVGARRDMWVHTAVLSAFVRPRPPGLVCDHLDGNPSNNHAENLEWVTQKENIARGRRADVAGIKHPMAKLTEAQVIQIRKRYTAGGISQRALAAEFGVGPSHVSMIILRKTWKHI